MEEDPAHIMTVPFVRMMGVRMVMEVGHVRGCVVSVEVVIVPEFVIRCYWGVKVFRLETNR